MPIGKDRESPQSLVRVGRDLGHGLAAAVCLVDVRTFVFGGGFAAALDRLESGIRRGVAEWAYGARVAAVSLKRAELGPAAGWVGAAHLSLAHARARPGFPT